MQAYWIDTCTMVLVLKLTIFFSCMPCQVCNLWSRMYVQAVTLLRKKKKKDLVISQPFWSSSPVFYAVSYIWIMKVSVTHCCLSRLPFCRLEFWVMWHFTAFKIGPNCNRTGCSISLPHRNELSFCRGHRIAWFQHIWHASYKYFFLCQCNLQNYTGFGVIKEAMCSDSCLQNASHNSDLRSAQDHNFGSWH